MEGNRTRRALLGAGLGALVATAANALGRPSTVRAADVVLGSDNTATAKTSITNNANSNTVLEAVSSAGGGSGTAISGVSTAGGVGVAGSSNSTGVRGDGSDGGTGVLGTSASGLGAYGLTSGSGPASAGHTYGNGTAVMGFSTNDGNLPLPTAKSKTGVYGHATVDADSRGVWGRSNAGVGVFGEATTGFALRTDGRIRIDKVSGVATIPAGAKTVTVNPGVTVPTSAFVMLTPMVSIASRALWFTLDTANNRFTIRMNTARSSATKVAWLLIG
jgi:hypothetical protein